MKIKNSGRGRNHWPRKMNTRHKYLYQCHTVTFLYSSTYPLSKNYFHTIHGSENRTVYIFSSTFYRHCKKKPWHNYYLYIHFTLSSFEKIYFSSFPSLKWKTFRSNRRRQCRTHLSHSTTTSSTSNSSSSKCSGTVNGRKLSR